MPQPTHTMLDPMTSIAHPRTLIIGYGNTLREDDGVGYCMAEAIAQWNLTGIESKAVHQLTPDLAAHLAEVDRVIFIDVFPWTAEADPQPLKSDEIPAQPAPAFSGGNPSTFPRYRLVDLTPGDTPEPDKATGDTASNTASNTTSATALEPILGHSSNPRSILTLAQSLYGINCQGWWLLIPGQNFGFGETFSDLTTQAQTRALTDLKVALLEGNHPFWTTTP
ncbi:MAG: hypothetical protein ACO34J_15215 [Prochlorothrix sp.]